MRLFLIVGLCFLLQSFPVFSDSGSDQAFLNSPAPAFTFPDINNQLHSFSSWQGKILIINFWATWCTPCIKEIPLLNKLQKEYVDDGLQVVGIAIDNPSAVKKFIQLIPIEYINLIGGTEATSLTLQYGNRAGVLPYTVIVNKQGKIVSIARGLLTETYLRQTIEKWL